MKKFIFLVALFFIPHEVFAVGNGFSISPPFQEVILNTDNTQIDKEIEVRNDTAVSAVFNISAVDFGSLDNSGGVVFLGSAETGERKYGLASWIKLEKDQLVIEPNSSQKIKITISNKENLSSGGHYGAVLVTLNSNAEQGNVVGLKQSYASLFFVKKMGGEIYSLKLNKLDFKHNIFRINKQIKLNFWNDGNVHVVPRGKVVVTDNFGRVVLKQSINFDSSIIIPESFRDYFVKLEKVSPMIWPGKYTLSIDHYYDGENDIKNQQKNFFFVPFFWVLILPMVGVFFYVKKHRKN